MSFKLDVSELEKLSISDAEKIINSAYKKPLGELRLFDLLVNEDKETAMRHGVYMFFNEAEECIYVGMCSSSHFAHRIGGHFGMSPKYGMNTFLKRTIVRILGLKNEYPSYVEALPKISKYRILIIGANDRGKSSIRKLEKLLHIIYRPKLNFLKGFPSTYKQVSPDDSFSSSVSAQ